MYKAYKFRIYPDNHQRILLNQSFGCVRFIYNHYLEQSKETGYKNAKSYCYDYAHNLKYQYPFLMSVDSILIRNSIFNLDNAYQKFLNKESDFPKYKSKISRNSYTTNAIYRKYKDKNYCNLEVDLDRRLLKLPKIKWISIRGYRKLKKLDGRIMNATVSREPNGKYYVSIVVELPGLEYKIRPDSIVGIDLGIKKLLTLSDGIEIENNKYIEKYEKRIKRMQRALARKRKGSKNYYKCKQKIAILYSKLKNARNYYLHKITKNITDNYDIITCEKLNTKKMLSNHNLSKRIMDASLSEIIRQLQYKSKWKGKYFYQVDTYYPSSQICSVCNHKDSKYKDIKERIYYCSNCNSILDRDLNASINIMFEGIKLYMNDININYNFS